MWIMHLDFINFIHKHSSISPWDGSITTVNISSYTFIHMSEYIRILYFHLLSFFYFCLRGHHMHPFSSVQSFSGVRLFGTHESQHASPPCPSPTPRVRSDPRPLSQWCHSTISSSVVPFSSCLPSLPTSESFPMSQFFAWGGQSTGVSVFASFLPK